MTVSTLDVAPRPATVGRGAASNAETSAPRYSAVGQALKRAGQPGYFAWLEHVRPAAGCTRPIRLHGEVLTVDAATGQLLSAVRTADLPDGIIYKACGNRRSSVCPSCAHTYQRDAYHLLRAGLAGGKGIPETVTRHPAVFVTFTAPSFGPVHTRYVRRHTCQDRRRCDCRPEPCHPRRDADTCSHGRPMVCWSRHEPEDKLLGQPLCLDCYDHAHQVVWNLHAGQLWHRTKQAIQRHLAHLARQRGIPAVTVVTETGKVRRIPPVRVAHAKVAEFQARGAVHFHVLLRLDGIDPAHADRLVPPPAGITATDLDTAIRHAATHVSFHTPTHPAQPEGWLIAWGEQIDIRPITLSGHDGITDRTVAGYLAKYATKSTEATGHTSTRITADTISDYANPDGNHTARLIDACWTLGHPRPWRGLRRWTHMLGYGGHFLTKARRWSITFQLLRDIRTIHRRHEHPPHSQPATLRAIDHDQRDTTLLVGVLTFAGAGWRTLGDALLANTAAALARERHAIAREELTHELTTTARASTVLAA